VATGPKKRLEQGNREVLRAAPLDRLGPRAVSDPRVARTQEASGCRRHTRGSSSGLVPTSSLLSLRDPDASCVRATRRMAWPGIDATVSTKSKNLVRERAARAGIRGRDHECR